MDILEHFPTSQKLGICFRLRMGPGETFEFKKVLRGGIDCFRLQRTLWASINRIHFIHHFNHLMDTHKSNLYHTFVNIFSGLTGRTRFIFGHNNDMDHMIWIFLIVLKDFHFFRQN